MSLRFRKSIKIAPGVKVNLNKNSVSTTIGTRGAHYTVNSRGTKTVSAGIPGTGLSYTSSSGKKHKTRKENNTSGKGYSYTNNQVAAQQNPKKKKHGCLLPIGIFIAILFLLGSFLSDDKLSNINLSADTAIVYDVNTEIPISLTTKPDNYSISESDFDISGGTVNVSDDAVIFSANEEGTYTICAKHNDIESNTLTIQVEDKEAAAKVEEIPKAEPSDLENTERNEYNESDSQNNFNTFDNSKQQQTKSSYVLNTSTKKFHLPGCRDVSKIAPDNYSTYDGSKDDIVSQGYSPCGHCNP